MLGGTLKGGKQPMFAHAKELFRRDPRQLPANQAPCQPGKCRFHVPPAIIFPPQNYTIGGGMLSSGMHGEKEAEVR